MVTKKIKVFISYSRESPKHIAKVEQLSKSLRENGIDCLIDSYCPNPKEGWPMWLSKQIRAADFILIICTKVYKDRIIGEDENGHGSIWETNLIYQYIYNLKSKNSRFIPILFKPFKFDHIPTPLQPFTHYKIESFNLDDLEYKKLYRYLTNQNIHIPEIDPTIKKLKDQTFFDAETSMRLAKSENKNQQIEFLKTELSNRQDPTERYWIYITLGSIGGEDVKDFLKRGLQETNEFARSGAKRALKII